MAYTPNPVGYVAPLDFGNPMIITGKASEAISGGEPVAFSGAAACIGSVLSTVSPSDLSIVRASNGAAAGSMFNGVVIDAVESGAYVGVACGGTVIMYCDATVTAGHKVSLGSNSTVRNNSTDPLSVIGRALSAAGSEQFALIQINP